MNNSVVQWSFGNHEQLLSRERQVEGEGFLLDGMDIKTRVKRMMLSQFWSIKRKAILRVIAPLFHRKSMQRFCESMLTKLRQL